MNQAGRFPRTTLSAAMLALGLAAGSVQASGVQASDALDNYVADVGALTTTLDTIVTEHADNQDVNDDITKLKQQWSNTEYYEALEERAPEIYPLVWQAYRGLKSGLEQDASHSEVVAAADQMRNALWQGLGGLRVAYAEPAESGTAVQGDAASINAIQKALDGALGEYYEGELEEANEMIQNAYMQQFEGLEGKLIALDPELVEGLEEDFNVTLPNHMEQGNDQQVSKLIGSMKDRLDQAGELLADQEKQKPEVF